MSERLRCELCGNEDHDVLWGRPVAWTDDHRRRNGLTQPFATVNRCTDFQRCRGRVEAAGRSWPLQESVTRPTVRQPEAREEVPI